MKEPAITGGLTASEQILMWCNRVANLSRVRWILAPIKLTATDKDATWADVTVAKLVVGATGQFTLSIGEGDRYVELKASTVFYGIIHSLFLRMWDRTEMDDTLETDENFEIVASTLKCIYDQTCRKCGSLNRVIFYQLKEGRAQRKLRIGPTSGTARTNKSVRETHSRPRLTSGSEMAAPTTTTLYGRRAAGGIGTGTMTLARGLAVAATGAADSASIKGGATGHFPDNTCRRTGPRAIDTRLRPALPRQRRRVVFLHSRHHCLCIKQSAQLRRLSLHGLAAHTT